MHKILFVTNLRPWPLYGGHFIRCYNVIDSLCQHFRVILLTPQVDADCELRRKVDAWYSLPERDKSLSVWGRINNFRYWLRPYSAWVQCLEALCQQRKPQVTWFEQCHWGQYAAVVRRYGSRAIMDTANIQSELARQSRDTTPFGLQYIYKWGRYEAQRWHERMLFRHFDRIISVSETDRRYHAQFVGDAQSKLIPNYINEAWHELDEPVARADNMVVVTANFHSFQNKRGVEWLLTEVWPQVSQQVPEARLRLVGRGAKSLVNQANKLFGVTCIGEVPTVAPYLWQATIAAVPILHGSGSRFKILEALACSVPVVSTTLGAQGIDVVSGESAILADSAVDFAQAIVELLKDNKKRVYLAQNGLTVLRRDYGFEVNTERIWQIVDELIDDDWE